MIGTKRSLFFFERSADDRAESKSREKVWRNFHSLFAFC